MKTFRHGLLLAVVTVIYLFSSSALNASSHPEWTAPQQPFRISGNLYYVGSRDLAAYLITTSAGNILINGNLQTSPPQIRASVEKLGFKWSDTRILLNSQAHFDHAAGNAAILQQTGAKLMVMEGDVPEMESGNKHGWDGTDAFPPAHVSRELHDGDTVVLGNTVLTAHKTAGHTRGCTAWSMRVKGADGKQRDVVIVGGLSALDNYNLTNTKKHVASYPGIQQDFNRGFSTELRLPCDIFLGAHGEYFNMQAKLARMPKEGESVWVDPDGYKKAISDAQVAINQRVSLERLDGR